VNEQFVQHRDNQNQLLRSGASGRDITFCETLVRLPFNVLANVLQKLDGNKVPNFIVFRIRKELAEDGRTY
jgi:hypothetical protein